MLWADWHTGGINLADGSWVQNYLQWPDEDNPGMYVGMTCNVKYLKYHDYA